MGLESFHGTLKSLEKCYGSFLEGFIFFESLQFGMDKILNPAIPSAVLLFWCSKSTLCETGDKWGDLAAAVQRLSVCSVKNIRKR